MKHLLRNIIPSEGNFTEQKCYDGFSSHQNSVVLLRKRTILTERPPLVGEVSANLLRIEGVAWSAQRIPTAVFSVF
jgi:hypothetical protein